MLEPHPLRKKVEIAVRLLALAGLITMYLAPCSDRAAGLKDQPEAIEADSVPAE